jgi:TPR repeat protein
MGSAVENVDLIWTVPPHGITSADHRAVRAARRPAIFCYFLVAGFGPVGNFLGALFLPLRASAVPMRLCKECAQSSRAAPFFCTLSPLARPLMHRRSAEDPVLSARTASPSGTACHPGRTQYAEGMTANRFLPGLLTLLLTALPLFSAEEVRRDKDDPDALLALAARYYNGNGVPRDLGKAAKLHRKLAEMGDARGQCLLGLDYANGEGVKKNMTEAARWLRKAADQGSADAQFDLGMCYANGEIEGRSIVDAADLYRKAAEQGLPQAQAALGNCYLEGTGVPKSIPDGVKWTRKAAQEGFPPAQHTLGICYTKGRGVVTNYVEAYKWLTLAAAKDTQNPDEIRVHLSMVERFLTPEQIAEGQRLAAEFVPGPAEPHAPDKAGASARTGMVNVKGEGAALEIFVDGAFVGNTPAKLKLGEGPHVIEVKQAGFKDYRRQVQVSDGSELTLNVVLER